VPELVPEEIARKSGMKVDQRMLRQQTRMSSAITTPSSSARRPATATWPPRCATSSTRPAACG
jgi:hypothetical protein